MSKQEKLDRIDQIYANADREGREINDAELATIEQLTEEVLYS